jgi:hypothetical protein
MEIYAHNIAHNTPIAATGFPAHTQLRDGRTPNFGTPWNYIYGEPPAFVRLEYIPISRSLPRFRAYLSKRTKNSTKFSHPETLYTRLHHRLGTY